MSLTIYSLPNCAKCEMAKNIAKSKSLPFEVKDLADADVRKTVEDMYKASGTPMPREAPIVQNDDRLMGFDDFRKFAYTGK